MIREKVKIAHNVQISMENDGTIKIVMPINEVYNFIIKKNECAQKVEEIIVTIPGKIEIFGIPVRFISIDDNNILN